MTQGATTACRRRRIAPCCLSLRRGPARTTLFVGRMTEAGRSIL